MPVRLDVLEPGFSSAFDQLVAMKREIAEDVDSAVLAIIDSVRKEGDAALIRFTEKFDRVNLAPDGLQIGQMELDEAAASCDPATLEALNIAAARIEAYHRRQLPVEELYTDDADVELGHRWTAVSAVGVYVPGGRAAYPSSVLMNALPARVAGVQRIAMTVPSPDGVINPLVLAAAKLAGVSEVYRVGGAQAIAALAYGTAAIRPVDKIVGPGNAYVAAAKRHVFGTVGIDMIAGPSEILVVADSDNNPDWIAADLLSQAEHDESAQSILLTTDRDFAVAVEASIEAQLATLPRQEIARKSWQDYGAIIVVPDLEQATSLVDRLAPEHLELAVADPDVLLGKVRNAGAIFLGRYTPEAIGDYVAGPNHVLPTARSARFSSGLSVLDFMKRTSIVRCDAGSLRKIGPAAVTLAEAEGLSAHARSVELRLNLPAGGTRR